jgi:hypothetical protein
LKKIYTSAKNSTFKIQREIIEPENKIWRIIAVWCKELGGKLSSLLCVSLSKVVWQQVKDFLKSHQYNKRSIGAEKFAPACELNWKNAAAPSLSLGITLSIRGSRAAAAAGNL